MLKYIIIQRGQDELPYVFPTMHQHDDFFATVRQYQTDTVVGAGFVRFIDGEVKCGGESMTLRVTSRGQIDAAIITDWRD